MLTASKTRFTLTVGGTGASAQRPPAITGWKLSEGTSSQTRAMLQREIGKGVAYG